MSFIACKTGPFYLGGRLVAAGLDKDRRQATPLPPRPAFKARGQFHWEGEEEEGIVGIATESNRLSSVAIRGNPVNSNIRSLLIGLHVPLG